MYRSMKNDENGQSGMLLCHPLFLIVGLLNADGLASSIVSTTDESEYSHLDSREAGPKISKAYLARATTTEKSLP